MGNLQSRDELQFCSTGSHSLANSFMNDKDFRVDYTTSIKSHAKVVRFQKQKQTRVGHQHPVLDSDRWQQKQEPIDIPSKNAGSSKSPEIDFVVQLEPNTSDNGKGNSKAFVFEGIFSDINVFSDGLVEYTDSIGNDFREEYNSKKIQKTFPMGISFGGLSKSLWFKSGEERDVCFNTMIGNLPTSYDAMMDNKEHYKVPEWLIQSKAEDDKHSIKVFDGIEGNEVVVYKDNHVEYKDLDGVKHSVSYNKIWIRKCFPQGICFGGLDRTLWLVDEIERDLCFTAMQCIGEENHDKEEEKIFPGLYGNVVLKGDQVSFTSLIGKRMKASCFDAKSIFRVFPMGISGGGLPHSIWFEKMEDLEDCFKAMEQRCH